MKKTILFGNGLNYHEDSKDKSIAWDKLLEIIMEDRQFETKFLPNTIAYERIRLNWNSKHGESKHLKTEIAELLNDQSPNEYYKRILEIDCENYITTNYDYALNKAFKSLDPENTEINKSTEDLYSIRRNTILSSVSQEKKIWNIHGELKHPKSIMLGLNHYCGSVGKIDKYIKGTYDFSHKQKGHKPIAKIEDKLSEGSFDEYSWIELFFNSDIHIIGFGLDFSETDLWWVLTKRSRLSVSTDLINNRIFYYTKPLKEYESAIKKEKNIEGQSKKIIKYELEKRKFDTLKNLNVEVVEVPVENNWEQYWDEIFTQINR